MNRGGTTIQVNFDSGCPNFGIHVTHVARCKPTSYRYASYAQLRPGIHHKSLIYIYIFSLLLLLLLILLYVSRVTGGFWSIYMFFPIRVHICNFMEEMASMGPPHPIYALHALPQTTLSYSWAGMPFRVTTPKSYQKLHLTTCVSRYMMDST